MSVTAAIKTTLFYIIYPIILTYNVCLIILSPVLHIIEHIARLTILPLSFLGKFESLYIFFSVAAIIGLSTGAVLFVLSRLLSAIFTLDLPPEENGRTAASVRAARQKKKLQAIQEASNEQAMMRIKDTLLMRQEYNDYLSQDRLRVSSREKGGLLAPSQVILEEEDDSDDAFY